MPSVTASNIMTSDIISAKTDTPVSEIAGLMADNRLRVVPIFDEQDQLVGVVSEEDLVHQDARVHAGLFDGAERATLEVSPGRRVYVHVARGRITANGQTLEAGDALKLVDPREVTLTGGADAEVLVFDLP